MALAALAEVGMCAFGKHPMQSVVDLAAKAVVAALKDAGVSPKMVEAGFFANALALKLFGDSTIGQNVFWEAGINEIPVVNVENTPTPRAPPPFIWPITRWRPVRWKWPWPWARRRCGCRSSA